MASRDCAQVMNFTSELHIDSLFTRFHGDPLVFYSCFSAFQSIILIEKGMQVQPLQQKTTSLLRRMRHSYDYYLSRASRN